MVCVYAYACVCFFCHPVPQKSSCEVQAFESLYFYQLANRKRDQQIYNKCPFCSFLLNSLLFCFFVKFTDGANLLDPPEETHCEDHSKQLRKGRRKTFLQHGNIQDDFINTIMTNIIKQLQYTTQTVDYTSLQGGVSVIPSLTTRWRSCHT